MIGSICADAMGFVWVTTIFDINRFNGYKFDRFDHLLLPNLTENMIKGVFRNEKGELVTEVWNGDVFRISEGTLQNEDFLINIRDSVVFGDHQDFYTISFFNDPNSDISARSLELRNNIYFLNDSTLWWSTDTGNGFDLYLNGCFRQTVTPDHGKTFSDGFVLNGRMLFFDRVNNRISDFTNPQEVMHYDLQSFTVDDQSALYWQAFEENAYIVNGNNLYSVSISDSEVELALVYKGFNFKEVSHIFKDNNAGRLFIGTQNEGLFTIDKNGFNHVIKGQSTFSMVEAGRDSILISDGQLFNPTKPIGTIEIPAGLWTSSFVKDSLGRIWSVKENYLMCLKILKGRSFVVDSIPLPKIDKLRTITLGAVGTIWIAGEFDIYRLEEDKSLKKWMVMDKPISTLFDDTHGKLWIGSEEGLFRMDYTQGRPEVVKIKGTKAFITSIRQFDNRYLWVTSFYRGIMAIDNDTVIKLPFDTDMHIVSCHCMLADDDRNIWVSTNRGLFKLNYSNLTAFIEKKEAIDYFHYDSNSGLPANEFNGLGNPCGIKSRSGYIFFPAVPGVISFHPHQLNDPDISSGIPLHADILIDGKPYKTPLPELDPDFNQIQFALTPIYHGNRKWLDMEYRLPQLSNNWMQVAQNDEILFSRLPYGRYNLEVRVRTRFGYGIYQYFSFPFTVRPYLYQSWEFVVFMIILGIILLYLALKLRQLWLVKKNRKLNLLIKEKTANLKRLNEKLRLNLQNLQRSERELKKVIANRDLLISVISHDIRSPLKFILDLIRDDINSILVDSKQRERFITLEISVQKVLDFADNLLAWVLSQDDSIKVSKINFDLSEFIEEIRGNYGNYSTYRKTVIQNEVSPDTNIFADKNVLLIVLNNVISNALRYTWNGTIRVAFHVKDDQYEISIADNGKGSSNMAEILEKLRSPKSKNKSIGSEDNAFRGMGLRLIKTFMEIQNGSFDIDSVPGKGTRVILRLPLS